MESTNTVSPTGDYPYPSLSGYYCGCGTYVPSGTVHYCWKTPSVGWQQPPIIYWYPSVDLSPLTELISELIKKIDILIDEVKTSKK